MTTERPQTWTPIITTIPTPTAPSCVSPCIFPYKYKNKMYYTCTTVDSLIPWCAAEIDETACVIKATYCDTTCNIPTAPNFTPKDAIMTLGGKQCQIPFNYQGVWYFQCIVSPGCDQPWCATEISIDGVIIDSDYCIAPAGPMPSPPPGGFPKQTTTEPGMLCKFPFLYLGKWYTDCTHASNSKVPWCAIVVDANGIVVKSGICMNAIEINTGTAHTVQGTLCVFPFVHMQITFSACTNMDDTQPWCATHVDEQRKAIKRGYCRGGLGPQPAQKPIGDVFTGEMTIDGKPCIFPFNFEEEEHWGCTGTSRTANWCATEVNHLRKPTTSGYCS
ncbi:unnamed protein product, partial [Meganyctiphanes norvegica]